MELNDNDNDNDDKIKTIFKYSKCLCKPEINGLKQ